MKFLFLLIFIVSCSKAPLFAPLEDSNNSKGNIQALKNSDEYTWVDKNIHFAIKFENNPSVSSNSPFIIKFWDTNQTNFLGPYQKLDKELCVFLWMKMASGSEHGSSPVVLTQVSDPNGDYYKVEDVYFIMTGNWQIRIRTVADINDCRSQKTDPYLEEKIIEINIR